MALPDIPRLYTALAEWLAVVLYAQSRPPRFARKITLVASGMLAVLLGVFLEATGEVPIAWWVPCMGIAVGMQYLYLWITREENWLEAAYDCARSFILAEFAASVEWQLHCTIFPQHGGGEPMALFLLLLVYSGLFGVMYGLERKRPHPTGHLDVSNTAALVAVVMAATAFAVSNLNFLNGEVTMSVFYIRTLVDFCGVLILTVEHDQLREEALHKELTAMDSVLHRQYEQYKRSKEGIKLINRRYHELKVQIADIRAERDRAKQDAALARMESGILQYEAENKTGNPVLDTLLTAKKHGLSGEEHPDDQRGRRPGAGVSDHAGDLHHRGHRAGQRHRELRRRAGPRKTAHPDGGLCPERVRDVPVRELLRPAGGAGGGRSARAERPRRLRFEEPAFGGAAARWQHDRPLGEPVVHGAGADAPAQRKMTTRSVSLRSTAPPKGGAFVVPESTHKTSPFGRSDSTQR